MFILYNVYIILLKSADWNDKNGRKRRLENKENI